MYELVNPCIRQRYSQHDLHLHSNYHQTKKCTWYCCYITPLPNICFLNETATAVCVVCNERLSDMPSGLSTRGLGTGTRQLRIALAR